MYVGICVQVSVILWDLNPNRNARTNLNENPQNYILWKSFWWKLGSRRTDGRTDMARLTVTIRFGNTPEDAAFLCHYDFRNKPCNPPPPKKQTIKYFLFITETQCVCYEL